MKVIIGIVIGILIMVLKEYFFSSRKSISQKNNSNEFEQNISELNFCKSRNKELEDELFKLKENITKLKKESTKSEDDNDDLRDGISKCNKENSKLKDENKELHLTISEYKEAIASLENEVESLKNAK